MNLKQVIKQLKKEAGANKGKAIFLGLVLAVALYAYAPLVAKWFGGASSKPAKQVAAPVVNDKPVTVAANPVPRDTEKNSEQYGWSDVKRWIESDALMQTATLPEHLLDPFRIEQQEDAEDEPEIAEVDPEASEEPVDPQTLGMVLTSTLVGSRRSVVQIDGETYEFNTTEGEKPTFVVHNSGNAEYQFRIVGVAPGHVQLERDGQVHDLRIKQSSLADTEKIQFHGSNANPSPNG